MAFYKQVTSTKTIGVIVRIVCEVCGEEFSVHGNFISSGSSGSFKMAEAQKAAEEQADKEFLHNLLGQPPLFWQPCVRCGCIQSWAHKFYLANRVLAINMYITLWCLGTFAVSFFVAVVGRILAWEKVWGIAPFWKTLAVISTPLAIVSLVSWLPLVIIFSIISRRRFKQRLNYWLKHPNYSGPRNPSIKFAPPREEYSYRPGVGNWEVIELDCPGLIGLALEDFREKLGVVPENEDAPSRQAAVYEVVKQEPRPDHKNTATIFDTLLDALCCIMCADGKMSPEEQNAIPVILGKVVCPWTAEEIVNKIVNFLRRRKDRGLDRIIQETCERLPEFKGKETVFLKCIDYMAKADGVIDEKEIEIRRKFKAALADPPPKKRKEASE